MSQVRNQVFDRENVTSHIVESPKATVYPLR
jgi:hypothetical protein